MLAAALALAAPAHGADPVKGDVRVFTDRGFARLVFRLDEPVDASVSQSGEILVIRFKKPVDVAVDNLNAAARDYISAARRDPDGTAIRMALARKVKINTIPAGEWLYVDLLPENWTGVMPGLPQEVIDELARRARDAERQLHQQKLNVRQQTPPTIRVRVATQPTFTRYIFDMPDQVNVVPERSDEALTLTFDQPIKWDLGEAKVSLPPTLQSIESVLDYDSDQDQLHAERQPGSAQLPRGPQHRHRYRACRRQADAAEAQATGREPKDNQKSSAPPAAAGKQGRRWSPQDRAAADGAGTRGAAACRPRQAGDDSARGTGCSSNAGAADSGTGRGAKPARFGAQCGRCRERGKARRA